jgi:hypothetical protein
VLRPEVGSEDETYNILDFASSNPTYTQLTPMGISVYKQTTNEGNYLCSTMAISSESIVFPIARISNWKTKTYHRMDEKTLAMSYTLGALFLVPTVIGLLKIFRSVYVVLNGMKIALMENWLNFCVFAFCICTYLL